MGSEKKDIDKDYAIRLAEKVQENELKKEEKIVDLVIRIIVKATLKEYYENCNTISEIQPDRTK
jgi:hypothetical protein